MRRVVALMLPGVTPSTLGIASPSLSANLPFSLLHTDPSFPESQLPIFQKLFSHACPTKAPGERGRMHSCWQAFTNCPLTGGEKTRREKSRKESEFRNQLKYSSGCANVLSVLPTSPFRRRSNRKIFRPDCLPSFSRAYDRTSLPRSYSSRFHADFLSHFLRLEESGWMD